MLEKLAELHKLCFPNKPWAAEEFASLQKSGAEIIASEHGFIVWRCAADECEIITIGVHPEHRGNGIGGALLGLMEKEIKKNNHPAGFAGTLPKEGNPCGVKIFLEVASDNTFAIKLYEKHGYKKIATRPNYYESKNVGRTDALVMGKSL